MECALGPYSLYMPQNPRTASINAHAPVTIPATHRPALIHGDIKYLGKAQIRTHAPIKRRANCATIIHAGESLMDRAGQHITLRQADNPPSFHQNKQWITSYLERCGRKFLDGE